MHACQPGISCYSVRPTDSHRHDSLLDSRHLKNERDASAHDDERVHQVPDVAQVGPGVRDHAKVDYLRDSANRASKKSIQVCLYVYRTLF